MRPIDSQQFSQCSRFRQKRLFYNAMYSSDDAFAEISLTVRCYLLCVCVCVFTCFCYCRNAVNDKTRSAGHHCRLVWRRVRQLASSIRFFRLAVQQVVRRISSVSVWICVSHATSRTVCFRARRTCVTRDLWGVHTACVVCSSRGRDSWWLKRDVLQRIWSMVQ